MSEILSPIPNPTIDHPVLLHEWLAAGRAIFNEQHAAMLADRFRDSGEDIQRLLSDVALAGSITDSSRMQYEAETRGVLHLDEAHRLRVYQELAGRPESVARFVQWFSGVAQEYFVEARESSRPKVGLELGGIRQAGDWSGTKPLDEVAGSIPAALTDLDPDAEVKILSRGKAVAKNYVVQPLGHILDGQYDPNFPHLLVRRRRGVADIYMPATSPINLFKESWALAVINQIDEKDAKVIRKAYKRYEDFEVNHQKNSSAAGAAGRAFERAIQNRRERSRAIIPISAHYVMVMHRPVPA